MKKPTFKLHSPKSVIDTSARSFDIRCQEKPESVDITIMDYIGDDGWGGGVSAETISAALKANPGKPVNMSVNSLGGSFYDGLSMYNDLAQHSGKVTAQITGIAFSAATLPVMAADHVVMPEASDFGVHRAWVVTAGNAQELQDAVEWLESIDEHAKSLYMAKTGATREQVTEWIQGSVDGTKFSAKEALEAGFADEVIPLKLEPEMPSNRQRVRVAMLQQARIKARLGRSVP